MRQTSKRARRSRLLMIFILVLLIALVLWGLAALADRLQAMGILNLYACIGYPQVEDEYLTKNSAQFHEHLGFTLAGTFHNCGYKFGRWYDMIWMEKIIGEHRPDQPDIVPYQY